MIYAIILPVQKVYKIDTDYQEVVDYWVREILGFRLDDYETVLRIENNAAQTWDRTFVEVKVKNGYTFTIQETSVSAAFRHWAKVMMELYDDRQLKDLQKSWSVLGRNTEKEVGRELEWLLKKYGGEFSIRRLVE